MQICHSKVSITNTLSLNFLMIEIRTGPGKAFETMPKMISSEEVISVRIHMTSIDWEFKGHPTPTRWRKNIASLTNTGLKLIGGAKLFTFFNHSITDIVEFNLCMCMHSLCPSFWIKFSDCVGSLGRRVLKTRNKIKQKHLISKQVSFNDEKWLVKCNNDYQLSCSFACWVSFFEYHPFKINLWSFKSSY